MPLDFTASGVKHTQPQGTLDFVSPQGAVLPLVFLDGAQSVPVGHLSTGANGAYLAANWNGQPSYKPSAGTLVGSWDNEPRYIGAGAISQPTQFGTVTLVQEKFVYPVGFSDPQFGTVQFTFDDEYVAPTARVNAKWANEPYSPSTGNQSASWSAVVQVNPVTIIPQTAFGSATIIEDKLIEVPGFTSTQFGNSYALRWFEYAPAWSPLNASWLGENVYTPSVGALNVAWVPPTPAQTVGPVSFQSSQFGTPRFGRPVYATGIAPTLTFGTDIVVDQPGCSNYTFTGQGNRVPINFATEDTTYQGNRVPVTFACDTIDNEFTLFDGFIDFATDAYAAADIVTSFRFDFLDGASVSVDVKEDKTAINDIAFYDGGAVNFALDTHKTFTVEFFSGEMIVPTGTGCATSAGLQLIANNYNFHSPTSSGFRLQNDGGGNAGSNVAAAPVNVSALEEIEFAWNQSLTGNWYDNDNSDAAVHFGLFFDRALNNVDIKTSTWEYNSPFAGYTYAQNQPWLRLWLPRDTDAKTNYFDVYRADSSTANSTFAKPSGLDYYGGARIRVRLTKVSGNVRAWFYVNDALQHSWDTGIAWPTTVFPLWHYRNYANSSSYVDVSNVQTCQGQDFLEVPVSSNIPDVRFYGDASVDAILATEATLPLNFYDGATLDAVLQTYAAATLEPVFYEGADAVSSLWTRVALDVEQSDGASAQFDLAVLPQPNILIEAYEGAAGSISLSLAIQLGLVANYDGARADLTLDSEPNWFLYDGSAVSLEIATETTLNSDGFSGELVSLALSTFPSEGLGVFNGYDGAETLVSFTTLPQVLLYPNPISAADEFNYDILGFMSVDLNNTTCCPIKDSHERIELTHGPEPYERYDGDKTVFTVDLFTLQRFKMDFYDGTVFRTIDPTYMEMEFRDASMGLVVDLDFADYNFNLCYGNFIPDGDNVNVELISTDLNNCEATVFRDGAEMQMDLAAVPGPTVLQDAGEYTDIIVTFDPALRLEFYAGENFRYPVIYFELDFVADGVFNLEFDEEAFVAIEGAAMTLDKLTTEYEVEFLEVGCLDNEFVPTNENGDADMERFNPVPVELDFFTHSIKARCF